MRDKKHKQQTMLALFIIFNSFTVSCFAQNPQDPYEGFNRAMFTFNDKLDIYLLKPVATFYNKIMPRPLNQGVHNFFNNINTLPTIANDVLQLNLYQAGNDLWRVTINTTVGIGGLFDVASRMNLPFYSNDFGLTLAKWGYKNSNYLVLPFFGSSTIRDGLGLPVDYFAFSVYPYIDPQTARYEVYGLGVVDKRAQLLKVQPVLEEVAFDNYAFMRNAYMQRRAFQIEQNNHRGPGQQNNEISEVGSTLSPATVPSLSPPKEAISDKNAETSTTKMTNDAVPPDAALDSHQSANAGDSLSTILKPNNRMNIGHFDPTNTGTENLKPTSSESYSAS